MEDPLDAVHEGLQVRLRKVGLHQVEAGPLAQRRYIAALDSRVVVGVEAIHPDDIVTQLHEALRQVRANKAGHTGD